MDSQPATKDGVLPAGVLVGGKYRIEGEIAFGDMGRVYAAVDTAAGGKVALKVLHPERTSDPSFRRRFQREAAVLDSLAHPAIVRVLDAGTDSNGVYYIAMEYLEGVTLRARLDRDKRLSGEVLLPIVRDLCAGLEAAHGHGVIHGDLAPGNIVLVKAPPSCVRILDFGLSKILGLERLTATGEVIGTPHYMAPELLTGSKHVDARTDTYALGVILYEALSGALSFSARHAGQLVFEIVGGQHIPLETRAPWVKPALARVVTQAMATEPANRFATAGLLCAAFAAAVSESG